jgi:penicillin-binding protein 2
MLVDNRPAFDLCVIPERVQDWDSLFHSLNDLIGLDTETSRARLQSSIHRQPFKSVCLKRDISRDELAVLETHRVNLPGVTIEVTPLRHYLHEDLACHILGYLGEISDNQLQSGRYPENKPGDLIGKSGVERRWHGHLSGHPGGEQVEEDAQGRRIRVLSRKPPVPGSNLYLTIDKDLQRLAEKAMSAKRGGVVAVDPNTGEILALVSRPSFDPNLFIGGIDRKTWISLSSSESSPLQDRVLTGQYPPGSIFKIIVALAALEEGLAPLDEEVFCNGAYYLGQHRFRCWKKHGHGRVNFHRAMVESCDVYFYTVGKRLGVDKIAYYSKQFGLGQATGFDVGNERGGLIPTSEWKLRRWGVPWQAGETISTSIGQSFVLVTPMQMAVMMSAVFNGGVIYKPQVTKMIKGTEGETLQEFAPEIVRKVKIKPEHLEYVKRALVGVVNQPRGTGSKARHPIFKVAGKTGTAQVISLEKEKTMAQTGKVPEQFQDHAWFVAAAPAEDPKIAIAVLVENGGHGGSAAAPIAGELIEAYLASAEVTSLAKK